MTHPMKLRCELLLQVILAPLMIVARGTVDWAHDYRRLWGEYRYVTRKMRKWL